MTVENILREKAAKYILCFNDNCPHHVHCLHWQVAQCVSEELPIVTSINPRFKQVVTNECSYYVNNIGKVYHHNNLDVSHLIVVPDNS